MNTPLHDRRNLLEIRRAELRRAQRAARRARLKRYATAALLITLPWTMATCLHALAGIAAPRNSDNQQLTTH